VSPKLVTHEATIVVGIELRTSNAAEADPEKGGIASLWARFYREDVLSKIPRKTTPVMPMGVYTDYESDHTGPYRLLAGAAVEKGAPVPDGFGRATIPAGRYLLFKAEGDMPRVVIETWEAIWDYFSKPSGYARAYTADFERYPGPKEIEIHIAVR
jgi:predicted transcriptional regulator YdeE